MNFCAKCLSGIDMGGRRVIEFGSLNINGSVRVVCEAYPIKSYLGIDIVPGRDVDLVMPAEKVKMPGAADLVICVEMLEHAKDWRGVIRSIKRTCAPDGYMLVTTRSPGYARHCTPDYWRFSIEDFRYIFADSAVISLMDDTTPGALGFFHKTGAPRVPLGALHPQPAPPPEKERE